MQRTNVVQTEDDNMNTDAQQEHDNIKTHLIFALIVEEGKIYMDQTGRFQKFSSKVIKYIMVIYLYDANTTLIVRIKIGQ